MPTSRTDRDDTRDRIIDAAAVLLAAGGPSAVTTRSVAAAAEVQPPTIYRLFGDKDGLLEAVADAVFAEYVDAKHVDHATDPVQELHDSFLAHLEFGTANPGITAIFSDPLRPRSATEQRGIAVLRKRIHRVAAAGRLRVPEPRAEALVHSIGVGVTLTLLETPDEPRDPGLIDTAWQAVAAAILTDEATPHAADARSAAVRLRADEEALATFSPAERALLREWLDRIVDS